MKYQTALKLVRRSVNHCLVAKVNIFEDNTVEIISLHPDRGPIPPYEHLKLVTFISVSEMRKAVIAAMSSTATAVKGDFDLGYVNLDPTFFGEVAKDIDDDLKGVGVLENTFDARRYTARKGKGGSLYIGYQQKDYEYEYEISKGDWSWKQPLVSNMVHSI